MKSNQNQRSFFTFLKLSLLIIFSLLILISIVGNLKEFSASKKEEKTIPLTPEELAKFNMEKANYYFDQGLNLSQQKKYSEALGSFSNALIFNGINPSVLYHRGLVYHQLQQYKWAIKDFNQAIELNPNYANAYNARGLTYHQLKEYQTAINDFTTAIKINPNLAIVYYHRGLSYQLLENQEKALLDFNQAAQLYQQQNNQQWYNYTIEKIKELKN